jgi:hypothetical protein
MENTFDRRTDVNAWAAREHEIKLHEQVQHWGEALLPLLYENSADDLPERINFFEFLMTSVERNDLDIAGLTRDHEQTMIESTRSWYTDRLSFLGKERREEMIRRQFLVWLKIYKAGMK